MLGPCSLAILDDQFTEILSNGVLVFGLQYGVSQIVECGRVPASVEDFQQNEKDLLKSVKVFKL